MIRKTLRAVSASTSTLSEGAFKQGIALLTGATGSRDLAALQRKRLRVIGSVLRNRTLEEKAEIVRAFRNRFWPALIDGRAAPVIDSVLPITAADQAHQILADNRNVGKVILTVRDAAG